MTLNLPANYEHVVHPKHYNSHPSGVECIDVIEHFSFNLGTAFKYVMRRDDKGNAKQDINKAIFYIQRNRRAEHITRSLDYVLASLNAIVNTEHNLAANLFYDHVRSYIVSATDTDHDHDSPIRVNMLYRLIEESLINLLKTYD